MCDVQGFVNVTPTMYAKLVEDVAKAGLALSGTSGRAEIHACTLEWKYDEAAQTLTLQCIAKPFYVPCETVNKQIRELIDTHLARSFGAS